MEKLKKLFKRNCASEIIYKNKYGRNRKFKRFWKSKGQQNNYEEQFKNTLIVSKGETIIKQCDDNLDNKELMLDKCSTGIISGVLNNILSENSEAESISSLDSRSVESLLVVYNQKALENWEELLFVEKNITENENLVKRTENISTCRMSTHSCLSSNVLQIDKQTRNVEFQSEADGVKTDGLLNNEYVTDFEETDDSLEEVVRKEERGVLEELNDSNLFSSLFDEVFEKVIIKKLIDQRNLLANAISTIAKSDICSGYFFQSVQSHENDISINNNFDNENKRSFARKGCSSTGSEKYLHVEQRKKEEEETELKELEGIMEPSLYHKETPLELYISCIDLFLMRNLKKLIPSERLATALKNFNQDQFSKEVDKQYNGSNIKQVNRLHEKDINNSKSEEHIPKDVDEVQSGADKQVKDVKDIKTILLEKRLKELREDIDVLKEKIAEEMKRNLEAAAEIRHATSYLKRPNEFYGATEHDYEHGPLSVDVEWADLKSDYMRAKRLAAVDFIFSLGQMEEECLALQTNLIHARNKIVVSAHLT